MINIKHVLIGCVLAYSQLSISHEVEDDRLAIGDLLAKYSELHGTKFVADPRVKGKVKMIGLELEELTQANLLDILVLHNFTATEKDGVVYVLPRVAADIFNSELGEIWGSN